MKIKKILAELAKIVGDEAERNPEFSQKISEILSPTVIKKRSHVDAAAPDHSIVKRAANRRPEPVLDPLAVGKEGEMVLREALSKLSLELLRDIVAGYGMDPSKLVMKWKDPHKVVDRIVEVTMSRIKKGSAFREQDGAAQS